MFNFKRLTHFPVSINSWCSILCKSSHLWCWFLRQEDKPLLKKWVKKIFVQYFLRCKIVPFLFVSLSLSLYISWLANIVEGDLKREREREREGEREREREVGRVRKHTHISIYNADFLGRKLYHIWKSSLIKSLRWIFLFPLFLSLSVRVCVSLSLSLSLSLSVYI